MEELYKLIPDDYARVISRRLALDKLCEIRVRNGKPVRVCYDGGYFYLGENGLTKIADEAFTAGRSEAESIIMRACDRSLYTVTDTLKLGYISVASGVRIGVCGTSVMSNGQVSAVKDFTAVNIRLPHEVKNCAASLFCKTVSDSVPNILVISPPGAGKTTVLRDLCRIISDRGYNVLLCDEKYELAAVHDGAPTLDVGSCTDVISGSDKKHAFKVGISSMRPDVIMTDELFFEDMPFVERAAHCGISVIATVHAKDVADMRQKPELRAILDNHIFTRYAVISPPPYRDIAVYSDAEAI